LVTKSDKKRPVGKPVRRRENIIKMYHKETEYEVVDIIHLDRDKDQWWALPNTVTNIRVL
jgi:hypothetical protein